MSKLHISKVDIKNFRNFHDVSFTTTNHNVLVGRNDVGKTNLLQAIQYVFDSSSRPQEFSEYDVFQQEVDDKIEIELELTMGDMNTDENTKIFISNIGSYLRNQSSKFYIRLSGKANSEMKLEWKEEKESYVDIPPYSVSRTQLDKIFEVFYIPPHVDVDAQFKKFKRNMLREIDIKQDELDKREEINKLNTIINTKIKALDSVNKLSESLNENLQKFKVGYSVSIESKMAVKNLHENLEVYSKETNEEKIYPTAGDGRKKTVMYAMFNHHVQEAVKKIPIVLIEEPENHLFLTEQVRLSETIFNDAGLYTNVFMSTHSPQLLYKMSDNATVVRLQKTGDTTTKSGVFNIPSKELQSMKSKYQQDTAHAIFADKVMLVEGYSEKVLFDSILDERCSTIDKRSKRHILNIVGIDFKPYYKFLTDIGIDVYVKTDNDIKNNGSSVGLTGINRLIQLTKEQTPLLDIQETIASIDKANADERLRRRKLQKKVYAEKREELESQKLYLSEIDLEHDLAEALSVDNKEEFVKKLQKKKWHNLINMKDELFSLEAMDKILASKQFVCIKKFIEE